MRVLAIVLAALALPASASAAVVLRQDGATLHASRDKGHELCLTVKVSAGQADTCDSLPNSVFHPIITPGDDHAPVGVAVAPTVTAIGVGAGARVATVAHGAFRYAFLPAAATTTLLRFYDASGAVIGAARDDSGSEDVGGRVVFRAAGLRLRLRPSSEVEPTPLEPDHTVPATCETVARGRGVSSDCGRDTASFDVTADQGCGHAPSLVYGVVPARFRVAIVILGTGERLRVRTRALPPAFGAQRLVAVTVPRRMAIQAAVGFDATGRPIARRALRVGPGPRSCGGVLDGGSYSEFVTEKAVRRPVAPAVTVATAGGHPLRIADGPGRRLCAGLDRIQGCSIPSPDPEVTILHQRGRGVAGVVSTEIGSVDLRLDNGAELHVNATGGTAYTGRYAGHLHFIATTIPAGRRVTEGVARTADGRWLGPVFAGDAPKITHRTLPLADGFIIDGVTARRGSFHEHFDCVVAPGHADPPVQTCAGDRGRLGVTVSCRPRRALLLGTLPRGASGVTVLLGRGRVAPAVRRVRGIGRVWWLVVPANEAIRGVAYRGNPLRSTDGFRTEPRVPIGLPPAARQCGYDVIDLM